MARYLGTLAGKDVEIVIRKWRKQRTNRQNAWMWGVLLPLVAEAAGYDEHERNQLKSDLLGLCFGTHRNVWTDADIPNVTGSSDLTTEQFSTFMEWSVRWAAETFGLVVPLPDDPVGIDAREAA